MRVYFDTEFSSLWDPQLISVGFAAEDGRTLYVEIEHDSARDSRFVREVVVPLLEGHTMTAVQARHAIKKYLFALGPGIELVCDFVGDWWLLCGLLPEVARLARPRCAVVTGVTIAYTQLGIAQHHALNDAMALRRLAPPLQEGTD